MAKSNRAGNRRLPATPPSRGVAPAGGDQDPADPPVRLAHQSSGTERGEAAPTGRELWPNEPDYLITGTGCTRGHDPGEELIEARLGKVPSQRTTRIGVGLVLWAMLGLAFLTNLIWLTFALQVGLLWVVFSAIVQRRSGHRGRCWRTRSWRYAWGGLVPTPRLDPTREAE